jgi:hypothetical protein
MENRRSQARNARRLKIIQDQVGHECDSSTAIYTNSQELHQAGEFSQVA